MVAVGDRFESVHTPNAEQISRFATLVGDANPLHHDAGFAARSRFGGIIVSGAQLCSLMLAISGTRLSEGNTMIGVSFDAEFKRAVRCDEEFVVRREVTALRPRSSGTLVEMRTTVHAGGKLCVASVNRAVIYE